MTLRDHFRDVLQEAQASVSLESADPSDIKLSDNWTQAYIGTHWLQPIKEAFDDDGSGYITVTEVNRFVLSLHAELNWR